MLLLVLYLLVSLAGILAAAELFTNGIEWFGKRMKLGAGAVGSVLAAVGTALPETTIAILGIIAGHHAAEQAGIGAILGAPMMLSTLAMFVTGAAVLAFAATGKRSKTMHVDYKIIGRDLRTFFLVYMIAFGAAFIPMKAGRIAVGVLLLVIYAIYVKRTFARTPSGGDHDLNPLHFHRWVDEPHFWAIVGQLLFALIIMVGGAQLFLYSVTKLAPIIGITPFVLSVIITPIATELPEKFNSVTWVRQKKDTLALGNISGAMVFQSSVTPAIGIFFTSWELKADALASIVIAIIAAAIAWGEMTWRKRISPYSLLIGGLLYLAYPIFIKLSGVASSH